MSKSDMRLITFLCVLAAIAGYYIPIGIFYVIISVTGSMFMELETYNILYLAVLIVICTRSIVIRVNKLLNK